MIGKQGRSARSLRTVVRAGGIRSGQRMLLEIVDQWTDAALALTDRDLRLMERLARAQVRKAGGAEEGAVEEIKRLELDTAWGEERSGNTGWGDEPTGITEWAFPH